MTAGSRYIQAVNRTADLPNSTEGSLCWDNESKAMSVWRNGGWEALTSSPGDIFATLTYDYTKSGSTLDISEVYAQVSETTSPSRPAGVYEVGFSLTYQYPDINDSAYLRFRTNGGAWSEFTSEPKDVQDLNGVYYQFPFEHGGGQMSIEVEMRKEDALAAQLDCLFADTWFRRVG